MKKLLLFFIVMLLSIPTCAFTGEAEIDGIKYYIITKGQTAEVRHKNYSGDIVIPSSIEYEGVICSVVSIGEKAFYKCSELTSVTIPNSVSSIGTSAFNGCSSLSSVTIPQNVTSIGDFTFESCGLINFTIPNGVTSIGIQAFQGCGRLISVTIPNSVKSIGKLAFSGCTSLEKVIISDLSAWCDIYFESVSSNPLYNAKHLYLGESTEITDLDIPYEVTRIRNYAFRGCSGITSVTIPNSVKSIGEQSFYACEGLKLLTIGSDVADIYKEAFAYCKELAEVYCYAKKVPYTVQIFNNSFVEYATLYVPASLIEQYKAKAPWSGFGKIEILDYIDGIYYNLNGDEAEVTYLDDNYNSYSGTVVIPGSVTYRGKNFSVTKIGDNAFRSCSGLTSIIIPNSVNSIGSYAFADSKKLASVIIPDGVPNIAEYTFSNCSGLTSVTIPNSIKSIDTGAFEGCSGLTSISIPNNVTTIGNVAFKGCSSLTSVTIPNSVTEINVGAFENCSSLSDVYCIAEAVPNTHITTYDNSSIKSATLHTPNKSIHLYKQSSPWSSFGRFAGLYGSEYILSYIIDGSKYKSYKFWEDEKIFPEDEPTKEGHTFSGWSEIPETMPAHDVMVTGSFSINSYKLTYIVDGEEYKSYEINYGTSITAEVEPTKEGHTFSGWSEIPEKMPAHDVTVTGSFSINSYKLTYIVDGEEYKSYEINFGTSIIAEVEPAKIGHTFSGWSEIPETMPAHDVTVTGSFSVNSYTLTYMVDGEVYKTYEIEYGTTIIPEETPTKIGYTFSGWGDIPSTMPAKDVTLSGTFSINSYKLTYVVDGEEYKIVEVEYNSSITPEAEPTKEGHTFSGWSEIPETMPAYDVTVTGSFTVNTYTLTYMVDGEVYKTSEVDYGTTITPEAAPTKTGYTFSGWDDVPLSMPARDVTVSGTFAINSYKLTYLVDGEEYKIFEIVYDSAITPEAEPTKEGHTFSGWSEIPATMPAHDVTVTGTMIPNLYQLMYLVDGLEYKTVDVPFGTAITPEPEPEKEGYTFSGWIGLPETMPARLVIVTGTFSINSYTLTYMIDEEVYKQVVYEYGASITPEPTPQGDYVSFEWVGVPETMPAHDVTVTAIYETGIAEIMMMVQQGQVRIYAPNGKRLNKQQKGLNIVVMQDGTTKKVVVK